MSRMQIPHGNPVLWNSGNSLPTTVGTTTIVITILLLYYCDDFYFLTGVCACVCVCACSVTSDPLLPLLCPWDFPGKDTGAG